MYFIYLEVKSNKYKIWSNICIDKSRNFDYS